MIDHASVMSIHLHVANDANAGLQAAICEAASQFPNRKQMRHELRVITCYVEFPAVQELVNRLRGKVWLTSVRLMFEYMDIYRGRLPNKAKEQLGALRKWCRSKGMDFSATAVRAGALMHAKGYAILQKFNKKVTKGVVFITSGNATGRGLGQSVANVELSSEITTLGGVWGFVDAWDVLASEYEVGIDGAAAQEDEYGFKYALLASGTFLHKWTISLGAQLAIRYTLSAKGRQEIFKIRAEFQNELDLEQNSVSRQPLQIHGGLKTTVGRPLPAQFSRSYTVDTLLGRWCANDVWEAVEEHLKADKGFSAFRKKFALLAEGRRLDRIAKQEANFEKRLSDRGYIETDEERIGRWRDKIVDLAENDSKLRRIYYDLEPFKVPYDYGQRQEITVLYDSLRESLAMRRKGSVVVEKLRRAIENTDLDAIKFSRKEIAAMERSLDSRQVEP